MKTDRVKRNRIAVNVEDAIFDAMNNIAEQDGLAISELARSFIVNGLVARGALSELAMKRLIGVSA